MLPNNHLPTLRQQITELVVSEHLQRESIGAELSSEIEKKRGLVIKVSLRDKSQQEAAEQLLQGYTFTVKVN